MIIEKLSLRQLANEASEHYQEILQSDQELRRYLQMPKVIGRLAMHNSAPSEESLIERLYSKFDESRRHFRTYEAQYYDLGAVEAYCDDVQLRIDHPLHPQTDTN